MVTSSASGYTVSTRQKTPDEPSEWEIPMAIKSTPAPIKRKKTDIASRAPLLPASSRALKRIHIEALPELTSSFDPQFLLTKLSAGKTTQAYLAKNPSSL